MRAGRFLEANIANIAEEIETLGRSEKRELINRLAVLLTHLLKWRYQPAGRGNSRWTTIKEQRQRLADHVAENPSLRATLPDSIANAYRLPGSPHPGRPAGKRTFSQLPATGRPTKSSQPNSTPTRRFPLDPLRDPPRRSLR